MGTEWEVNVSGVITTGVWGKTGSVEIGIAGSYAAVVFTDAFADTDYTVSISPSFTTKPYWANKATTGFDIYCDGGPANPSQVDWIAKKY